jgi:hypothetical protein
MHNPDMNPSTHFTLNGKRRRYANGTVTTRHVRLDREADRNLSYLQQTLGGENPCDVVSISLICRRALHILRLHVASLFGSALEDERQKVREGSTLPRLRKQRKAEGDSAA